MTVYLDSIFSRLATERLPWDALVWTETQQSVSEELERFKTFKNKLSWDLKFVFVIPVVSKKMAKVWGAVCQLLNDTLSALIAQSNPNWTAILCGQDKPEGLLNDPRIRFIAFKEDPVRDNRPDMFDKMRQLVHHVATLDPSDGYIFKFDQDDILHNDAVEYMLNTRDPNGYIINKGFMLAPDGLHGRYLEPRNPFRFDFLADTLAASCGSCMACYYDTRPGGIGFGLFDAIAYQSHGWFEHLAILLGRPLNKVPFPAIVYNILHGNNADEGRRKPPKLRSKHLTYISEHFTDPQGQDYEISKTPKKLVQVERKAAF